MTKQEQIEEIKRVLIKTCKHCRTFQEDYIQSRYAEAIYNAGYRKVDKDSVILTKEEYIDLSRNYVKEQKEQAVKEFAEKLKNYFEDMLVDEFGNTTIDIDEFKGYIDDLLKEYEVEE